MKMGSQVDEKPVSSSSPLRRTGNRKKKGERGPANRGGARSGRKRFRKGCCGVMGRCSSFPLLSVLHRTNSSACVRGHPAGLVQTVILGRRRRRRSAGEEKGGKVEWSHDL